MTHIQPCGLDTPTQSSGILVLTLTQAPDLLIPLPVDGYRVGASCEPEPVDGEWRHHYGTRQGGHRPGHRGTGEDYHINSFFLKVFRLRWK